MNTAAYIKVVRRELYVIDRSIAQHEEDLDKLKKRRESIIAELRTFKEDTT